MIADWRAAPIERISSRARPLCEHAVKLSREPQTVTRDDIERLRAQGCDDPAIHDLTQVIALFAYYNRIADGLGIELEPEWQAPHTRG